MWDGMPQYIPVYPSICQDIQVYLMHGLHIGFSLWRPETMWSAWKINANITSKTITLKTDTMKTLKTDTMKNLGVVAAMWVSYQILSGAQWFSELLQDQLHSVLILCGRTRLGLWVAPACRALVYKFSRVDTRACTKCTIKIFETQLAFAKHNIKTFQFVLYTTSTLSTPTNNRFATKCGLVSGA
jgi:hypothetical protein